MNRDGIQSTNYGKRITDLALHEIVETTNDNSNDNQKINRGRAHSRQVDNPLRKTHLSGSNKISRSTSTPTTSPHKSPTKSKRNSSVNSLRFSRLRNIVQGRSLNVVNVNIV